MSPLALFCTFAILLIATPSIDGGRKKILGLFPHPGYSHFVFYQPILRELAERGHEVTVVSFFPDKNPPSGYIDVPLKGLDLLTNSVDLKEFSSRNFFTQFRDFFMLYDWGVTACNHTLQSEALRRVMKPGTHYDVILTEHFNTDCMMGVAYVLRAPVIALSSCAIFPWHYERMGMPLIPSYIPATLMDQSEEMSLLGRLQNWIGTHSLNFLYNFLAHPPADALLKEKFGPNVPPVAELVKDTKLMFVNQHFSLSGAKPLPPSVIELGGIHIQKEKPLDEDLKNFLDNAAHGVIFISWGSMIKAETMPVEKRDAIVNAMKRLKQNIVWKWESDSLPNKPENMYISKWLPQRDILCHPNVKVFMTHAGLMGSSETAYCGVPVVATPMYGDQFLNAASMEQRGMGVLLKYEDINEINVLRAVRKVLEKRYYDNAKMVSYSFKNRPQTALDTAVWWVQYVANTNGTNMIKSSSIHMSRFTYHCWDVYMIFSFIVLLTVLSWIFVAKKISSNSIYMNKLKTN